jgi:hypothetical protein
MGGGNRSLLQGWCLSRAGTRASGLRVRPWRRQSEKDAELAQKLRQLPRVNCYSCVPTGMLGPSSQLAFLSQHNTFLVQATMFAGSVRQNIDPHHAGMLPQGGQGGPPGSLGLAIVLDSDPLPLRFARDLMEVTYIWPPWLTGSHHPRLGAATDAELLDALEQVCRSPNPHYTTFSLRFIINHSP